MIHANIRLSIQFVFDHMLFCQVDPLNPAMMSNVSRLKIAPRRSTITGDATATEPFRFALGTGLDSPGTTSSSVDMFLSEIGQGARVK